MKRTIISGLTLLDSILEAAFYFKVIDFYEGLWVQDYAFFYNLFTSEKNVLLMVANSELKSNYSNNTNYLMNIDAYLNVIGSSHYQIL